MKRSIQSNPTLTYYISAFSLALLGSVGLLLASVNGPPGPNVLFILPDQWRAQAFGFAGDPNVKTPNLDDLQRHSLWFVNAVASVPVCSPTRASIMTGQRAFTHGVILNDVRLSTNATTLADVFRSAGYTTGYIGKWHLNGDRRSAYIPPDRRLGFDYWKALECTHAYHHSFYYSDSPEKMEWTGYDAFAQTHDAQQFIRNAAKSDKPFLLFLAWGPPHSPYGTAPARYRAMYHPESIRLRDNVPSGAVEQTREDLAGYYAHCSALDRCVGRVLATLEETGADRNTIVVFASDHGDMLGSHGMRGKQQPFEESVRVPLLIRLPESMGIKAQELKAPISSEDLMPTLLGLCALPIPKTVEGQDFSEYIRGGKDPSDSAALIACIAPFGEWSHRRGTREYRGIRTAHYTYVRDLHGPWLLFDNQADPFQLKNLVVSPCVAKLQEDLEATLDRKLRLAGDPFFPSAAYIHKWHYTVDSTGSAVYIP
jgi:arylsulfatase A-like enzyme